MSKDELYNVCEGMDNIYCKEIDGKTSSDAKVFTMQFDVNKCREEIELLQSGVDGASKSDNSTEEQNSTEVQNGNGNTNEGTGGVQHNSTTWQNKGEEDVQEELDDEGMELWLMKLKMAMC